MAERLNEVAIEIEPLPQARVAYNAEHDILLIESGEKSAVGEEMAEGIVVHYDKDDETIPADEAVRAVAIFIDGAEAALKPFVDALLAKHGISADETHNSLKVSAIPKQPQTNLTD